MNTQLIVLFREMADLTAPECAMVCRVPHSCCSPEYCDMVKDGPPALDYHPTLKYMGPNGCIVEPHLRPLCTLHTCEINGIGFKRGDPAWTKKYFKLRNKIEDLMFKEK